MKIAIGAGALTALLASSPAAFAQMGGGAGGFGFGGIGDAAQQMQPSTTGLGSVEGWPERRTYWLNPRSPDYAVAPAYPPVYVPYGYAAVPPPVYSGRSVYQHRHVHPHRTYRVFRPY